VIHHLILLGISENLTSRYLLLALAPLHEYHMPHRLPVA